MFTHIMCAIVLQMTGKGRSEAIFTIPNQLFANMTAVVDNSLSALSAQLIPNHFNKVPLLSLCTGSF